MKYDGLGNTEYFTFSSIPYYEDICTDDHYDSEFQVFKEKDLDKDAFEILDGINYRYGKYTMIKFMSLLGLMGDDRGLI